MKISNIKLVYIIALLGSLLTGCGEESSDSNGGNREVPQENIVSSKFLNDPLLEKVKIFNVDNLTTELSSLSENNYMEAYKKVQSIQLSGFPKLNKTFDLNTTSQKSTKVSNKNQKVIYESRWSRKDSYTCVESGTVSKEVDLTPRGHLDADTYVAGDNTKYEYNRCDYGNIAYNGDVTYHVDAFTKFDYTFGAIPLGTFTSNFNYMSTETQKQKITLNGTIKFTSSAQYKPEPDGSLLSLEMKYETVGDFIVTVYDKNTGETTKLTYNGLLEKVVYNKGSSSSSAIGTSVDIAINDFKYRKTSDYTLSIENGTSKVVLNQSDDIPGIINDDGSIDFRPTGYYSENTSYMGVGLNQVYRMNLADGTSRYIFDRNADFSPDASSVDGTPKYILPPSDVDLMDGVVVIGFDDCPPTTRLRNNLEELNIDYQYVNIYANQKDKDVLSWFNVSFVPYVGIRGSYFSGAYDKNTTELLLNLYGYDMDDTVVKSTRRKSASVKLEGWLKDLKSKPKHTAIAAAVDTPYLYQVWWVWSYNSKEEAQNNAIQKCEKARSERVSKGKKPVLSTCKIYSIDGVKQGEFAQ